ncbi:MAG: alanine--tRNA ligase [Candidatus Pacearchaeota archaeon]|jgi:alanyl-tRNA synthetase
MKRTELIQKYLEFFKKKDHEIIENHSLIPENDPTVLFTTAGMHPLVPFLLGQKHPQGKRLVGLQKCIRTKDIDEVGDEIHHTFFEMLGNWSLGDYGKKQAIEYSFEFLTKFLNIPKEKLAVTCFNGNGKFFKSNKDDESANTWKSLGIKKIKFLSGKDNWWGPAGEIGPCGPDTEMFVNNVEIWNDVFMEWNLEKREIDKKGSEKWIISELKQKNVDTGMGVERTVAILSGLKDNYLADMWKPIIEKIEKLSEKKYGKNKEETKIMRIIADHIKASVFLIHDGIIPSNKEQGYILRRLIRRAIIYGRKLNLTNFTTKIAESVFEIYKDYKFNKDKILNELQKEEDKFNLTLENGLKIFEKMTQNKKELSGKDGFLLHQSYGFPIEMTKELAKEKNLSFDLTASGALVEKHQELSKTASAGVFKSGLADHSEQTTKLHTAAHLLLASLKKVLNNSEIIQKGSNITPERLRLDFSFSRKLTEKEIQDVENLVNEQIKNKIPVIREEMSLEQARKSHAEGIFESKYGNKVSVYTIGKFSKEICTGPHVKNTSEIGKFKIIKEESSSSGVRRIKAIVE